jgi:hypothetical protein
MHMYELFYYRNEVGINYAINPLVGIIITDLLSVLYSKIIATEGNKPSQNRANNYLRTTNNKIKLNSRWN